ncbi:hypothetical protein EV175_007179 [Coemansia sp. RSA 1933]|nr:hypothetical protein EV175_007179 [Coemansia sp. RSA 1933]
MQNAHAKWMAQLKLSPPHEPSMARSSARQRARVEELRTKREAQEEREAREAAAKAATYGQEENDFFESPELLALLHVIPLSFYDIDWEDQVLSHQRLMLAKGVPNMF